MLNIEGIHSKNQYISMGKKTTELKADVKDYL